MYHIASKIFVHKHSVASALLAGALFGMCHEASAFGAPDDPSRNAMSLEFNSLDRNHNNKISREEANRDADIGSRFAKADRNRDGALDAGEYANFKSAIQQARLEAYLEDSTITAKIKTELLKESGFQGLSISVETLHGKVILSGFVDNGQQIRRAVEIASGIRGVNHVKNSLQLKG